MPHLDRMADTSSLHISSRDRDICRRSRAMPSRPRPTDSLHISSRQPSLPLLSILQTREMTFHSRTLITT